MLSSLGTATQGYRHTPEIAHSQSARRIDDVPALPRSSLALVCEGHRLPDCKHPAPMTQPCSPSCGSHACELAEWKGIGRSEARVRCRVRSDGFPGQAFVFLSFLLFFLVASSFGLLCLISFPVFLSLLRGRSWPVSFRSHSPRVSYLPQQLAISRPG